MNRPRVTVQGRSAAILLLVFAAALVLAQFQGLVHRVVHGQQFLGAAAPQGHLAELAPSPTAGHGHGHLDTHDTGAAEVGGSWLVHLFVGHDDEAVCRLFDQSSHAEYLPSLQAHGLVPVPLAPVRMAQAAAAPKLAPAAPRARGPPTTTA